RLANEPLVRRVEERDHGARPFARDPLDELERMVRVRAQRDDRQVGVRPHRRRRGRDAVDLLRDHVEAEPAYDRRNPREALAVVSASPAAAANLLRNPSLESATYQRPNCWAFDGSGTNSYWWTRSTDAHDGSFSERLRIWSLRSGDRELVSSRNSCAPAVV